VQVIFLDSGLKPIGWSFVFLDDEVGLRNLVMSKKLKTTIKQANWKSKGMFGKKKEYHNIVTTIYYQDKDTFIDTDSKVLFQMICDHFFYKYKKATVKIKLKHTFGAMFPQAYRLYMYNLIYKKLTSKKIKAIPLPKITPKPPPKMDLLPQYW